MIRQVKKEDLKRIWQIRNHSATRQYSNNPEEIPFEKHNPWFEKKYFSGQDNHCFILENDAGDVIGYCRYDIDDENDSYVVSIAVDPDYHSQGFGHLLLSQTLKSITTDKDILAETIKVNIPSVKLFQKNNFKIYKEDTEVYYWKYY